MIPIRNETILNHKALLFNRYNRKRSSENNVYNFETLPTTPRQPPLTQRRPVPHEYNFCRDGLP